MTEFALPTLLASGRIGGNGYIVKPVMVKSMQTFRHALLEAPGVAFAEQFPVGEFKEGCKLEDQETDESFDEDSGNNADEDSHDTTLDTETEGSDEDAVEEGCFPLYEDAIEATAVQQPLAKPSDAPGAELCSPPRRTPASTLLLALRLCAQPPAACGLTPEHAQGVNYEEHHSLGAGGANEQGVNGDQQKDIAPSISSGRFSLTKSTEVTLSNSVPSEAFAPPLESAADFYSPGETIIIFDWDDTICPTTALREETVRGISSQESAASLKDLVTQARRTLQRAQEVADQVIIVTNAQKGWIEYSCALWLPELLPALDSISFTSARSAWEPKGITCPTVWKAATFQQILSKFYSKYSGQSWKNVIVIGDGNYEHEALAYMSSIAPQGPESKCRAKSIRFAPLPSKESLTSELELLHDSLDGIAHHDNDLQFSFLCESI